MEVGPFVCSDELHVFVGDDATVCQCKKRIRFDTPEPATVIHVPDVDAPTEPLCWKQAPTMERCDRRKGHGGHHTWEVTPGDGTNHHNAMACEFCNPGKTLVDLRVLTSALKKALPPETIAVIIKYAREKLSEK